MCLVKSSRLSQASKKLPTQTANPKMAPKLSSPYHKPSNRNPNQPQRSVHYADTDKPSAPAYTNSQFDSFVTAFKDFCETQQTQTHNQHIIKVVGTSDLHIFCTYAKMDVKSMTQEDMRQ